MMKKFLTCGLVGIMTTISGMTSCTSESAYPVCSIELDLRGRDRSKIVSTFNVIAEDLGLDSKGYHRKFPSGTDITIGFLELGGQPVASLVEKGELGIFDLFLYPMVKEGLHEKVVSSIAAHFELDFEVPSDCQLVQ